MGALSGRLRDTERALAAARAEAQGLAQQVASLQGALAERDAAAQAASAKLAALEASCAQLQASSARQRYWHELPASLLVLCALVTQLAPAWACPSVRAGGTARPAPQASLAAASSDLAAALQQKQSLAEALAQAQVGGSRQLAMLGSAGLAVAAN